MRVSCPTCARVYDDAVFLTICPHDVGVGGGRYCRRHDLFDCPYHNRTEGGPVVFTSLADPDHPEGRTAR